MATVPAVSNAHAAPHGLRARLRRLVQTLFDELDERWDDNEALAHSWPNCH